MTTDQLLWLHKTYFRGAAVDKQSSVRATGNCVLSVGQAQNLALIGNNVPNRGSPLSSQLQTLKQALFPLPPLCGGVIRQQTMYRHLPSSFKFEMCTPGAKSRI